MGSTQFDSHKCAVCGDTIFSPRKNEIHSDCAAFTLIAHILKK